jgi:hypothetical protein
MPGGLWGASGLPAQGLLVRLGLPGLGADVAVRRRYSPRLPDVRRAPEGDEGSSSLLVALQCVGMWAPAEDPSLCLAAARSAGELKSASAADAPRMVSQLRPRGSCKEGRCTPAGLGWLSCC